MSVSILSRRTLLAAAAGLAVACPAGAAEAPVEQADYAAARRAFRTRLTRHGPSPDAAEPLDPPPGAERLAYRSGALDLAAWASPVRPGPRRPAVVFLHGGNVLIEDHWTLTEPYRKAGYVTALPALRGENGQGGDYSAFLHETDDVIAATGALAVRPDVDPARLMLAGHSIGATQAMLVALSTDRFRAAAAFSGAPDVKPFFQRFPEEVCFDTADPAEFAVRSALAYARSFKCPTRLWHGTAETRQDAAMRLTAERAQQAGLDVRAAAVPGDHFSALPEEIRLSLAFFGQR